MPDHDASARQVAPRPRCQMWGHEAVEATCVGLSTTVDGGGKLVASLMCSDCAAKHAVATEPLP